MPLRQPHVTMDHIIADDAAVPTACDQFITSDDGPPLLRKCDKNLQILWLDALGRAIEYSFMGGRIHDCRSQAKLGCRGQFYWS